MDEVEAEMERREQHEGLIAAISDAIRASAGGKWIEVRQLDHLYAVNISRVVRVWPSERARVTGVVLLDRTTGGELFITHIGNKPATIENWLQAVEG